MARADQTLPENVQRAAMLRDIPEEIRGLPYFYPKFSDSKAATKFVEEYARGSGYFLLRLSSKGNNYLSLSVSIENRSVRHVNVVIERSPTLKYYIVEQVKFGSFEELQKYYKDHRICNLEQIENVKLLHPINRSYDDQQQFDEFHSASNGSTGSRAIQIPGRKRSETQFPKTPSAHQLTAQFSESFDFPEPLRNGGDYLPGAEGGQVVRRNSNINRPLPRTPPTDDDSRPPCPPPPGAGDSDLYYSRPRDETRNRIDELRQILRDSELCDCGVPLAESELPQGWTLHKSNDARTYGCLFYQSAKGDTTWNLPLQIVPEITPEQKKIIVKYSHQSGKPPPKVLMPPYQDSMDSFGDSFSREQAGQRNFMKNVQGAQGGKRPSGREGR